MKYISLLSLATVIMLGFIGAAAGPDDPGKSVDVTATVSAMVKSNTLSYTVENTELTDPSEGDAKKLRIVYTIDNVSHTKCYMEHAKVNLSAPEGKTLVITKAAYGVISGPIEVTDKVSDFILNNKLSITADNDTLGADPEVGETKELRIDYTVDGKPHTLKTSEGDPVTLPTPSDGAGAMVITDAVYGLPDSDSPATLPQ